MGTQTTGYTVEGSERTAADTVIHTIKTDGPDGYRFNISESTATDGTVIYAACRQYGYFRNMDGAVCEAMNY